MTKEILAFFTFLSLLSNNVLTGQAYSIYFPNNETELIQLEKKNQVSMAYVISGKLYSNVQLGYSPIKHLSLAGAVMMQPPKKNEFNRKSRTAYTASVGAYFHIFKKSHSRRTAAYQEESVPEINQWLLHTQIGFSNNHMYTSILSENSGSYTSEIDYKSIFLTVSLSHRYKWGLFTFATSYRQLFFEKAVFEGSLFNVNQIKDITTQLQNRQTFGSFNIGIHNRVGLPGKGVYGMMGANLPTIYFQQFKNRAAEIDGAYIYLGLALDVGELVSLFSKRGAK